MITCHAYQVILGLALLCEISSCVELLHAGKCLVSELLDRMPLELCPVELISIYLLETTNFLDFVIL